MKKSCFLQASGLALIAISIFGCSSSSQPTTTTNRNYPATTGSQVTTTTSQSSAPSGSSTVSNANTSVNVGSSSEKVTTTTTTINSPKYPVGIPVAGKKGFVKSPYAEYAGLVDVRGFPSGTQVKCPYTQKIFIVP